MLKRRLFILMIFVSSAVVHGQQTTPRARTPAPKPAPATPVPKATPGKKASLDGQLNYIGVGGGVPSGRVDAGSRGDGDDVASLYVIAPDHVGLTTRAQPTLHWFQSAPAQLPFEISILKPNDPKPLLRVRRTAPTDHGFHRLDLADHDVRLSPGVDYQWVVALVRDPESRSRDIVSSGWIRHVAPRGGPIAKSDAAGFASAGIWYDAVTALFAQIAARPNDAQLAANRRGLFTQVGLPPLPALPAKKRP